MAADRTHRTSSPPLAAHCKHCREPLRAGDNVEAHFNRDVCIAALNTQRTNLLTDLRAVRSSLSKLIDDHGKSLDVGATNSVMALHAQVDASLRGFNR